METIRLNKWLSELGVCSRREADRLVECKKITVDGKWAVLGQKVSKNQRIVCDGKLVWDPKPEPSAEKSENEGGWAQEREEGCRGNLPKPVWLVVNKPKGIVCTTSKKDRAKTIVELVQYPFRVYPVGRLDKDSRGLIFMTNQGDLVNQIMRGGNGHEKEYEVLVNKPITKEFLQAMASGVELKELNQTTRPCRIQAVAPCKFRITLTQGLNRQIRRMCKALGYQVADLKRIRIMNICLGDLREGSFRKMKEEEYRRMVEILKEKGSSSLPASMRPAEGLTVGSNVKERKP